MPQQVEQFAERPRCGCVFLREEPNEQHLSQIEDDIGYDQCDKEVGNPQAEEPEECGDVVAGRVLLYG